MKVSTLIKKLMKAKPDKEVVIHSTILNALTPDFEVSYDDNGDVEIYVVAGSKPY